MKATKALTTAGVGAAIVAGSMLAVTTANAHFYGNSDERAAALAERFDLDAVEVQRYFEEKKAEKSVEREEKRNQHIASLVSDGTLTQEQADALDAKWDEMKSKKDALKEQELSSEEMREQFEQSRSEFNSWAESEGINIEDIKPQGFGHKHRMGVNNET